MSSIIYKAFINDTELCFTDIYDADALSKADGEIISASNKEIKDVITEIEKRPKAAKYFYLSSTPKIDWEIFLSYYKLIEASGGIVQNKKGEYLVIFRRGKWDLPKGKLDYDETPEQAALREVEEECGVKDLEITQPTDTTFHTYSVKGKDILKKTHWFMMKYNGTETPVPQADEDIERAIWMSAKEIKTVFYQNTYESIKQLLMELL